MPKVNKFAFTKAYAERFAKLRKELEPGSAGPNTSVAASIYPNLRSAAQHSEDEKAREKAWRERKR